MSQASRSRGGFWWTPMLGAAMATSGALHAADARVRVALITVIAVVTALVVVLLARRRPMPLAATTARQRSVWPMAIGLTVFMLAVFVAADRVGISLRDTHLWLVGVVGGVGLWEMIDGLRRREILTTGLGLTCLLLVAFVFITPLASRVTAADIALGLAMTISTLCIPRSRGAEKM